MDDQLWGALQPTDVGQIPNERDSTNYTGLQRPDWRFPLYAWLDIEGEYAFTVYSSGFRIWGLDGTANARDPELLSGLDGWQSASAFPSWPAGNTETRELIFGVDVPDGNSNLAVVSGFSPIGVSIWNTTSKTNPVGTYADSGRTAFQVYAAEIGATTYAFAAAEQSGIGLHVYNMTVAGALDDCVEDTTVASTCGVYRGRIGATQSYSYIHGLETSAGRHFIAATSGTSVRGVEIWEVSNPLIPVNVKTGGGRFLDTEFLYGVGLWEDGGSRYLGLIKAVGNQAVAQIYNVTSCLNSGCSSLGAPLWTSGNLRGSGVRRFVSVSKVGSTPYLYFGLDDMCSPGLQREYLYNVDNPSSPVQVGVEAGTVEMPNDGGSPDPYPIDYWAWYYAKSPTGFSQVQPRAAKFSNAGLLYRAAWTIFDVHDLGSVDPSISVAGPATGFIGQPAVFTASAANCNPASNGWSWTLGGGGVGSSSSSTISATWSTTGTKSVSATNSACGVAQGSTTVNIQDPSPNIGSVTASPTTAPVCTPITFTANNVTGQPPLDYDWTVAQGADPPVANGSTNPFVWNTPSSVPPGTYTATVTVSGVGTPDTGQTTVTLTALAALPTPGFGITASPPSSGTVVFSIDSPGAPGATQWEWDFGDGDTIVITDPLVGPNPTHVYEAIGTYEVSLEVSNCQSTVTVTSETESVTITEINPLVINLFQASLPCLGNTCFGTAGVPVFFGIDVTGDPDFYDYDWDGNGSFEVQNQTAPVTSKTFTVGTYQPVVRVRRGTASATYEHIQELDIAPGGGGPPPPTPSVSISGPSTAQVGNGITLTGNATNCTPAATGWTWTVAGGSINGATNTNQISVSWASTGSKQVTARNSGCGSAQGVKAVTVTDPGGGGDPGGAFVARFTFAPTTPASGQAVAFDGRISSGGADTYEWNFGDGQTATGSTVNHSFATGGTYRVTLTTRRADPPCTDFGVPAPCLSVATHDVVVTGGQAGNCTPDPQTVCLLGGRFQVRVEFRDHHNGGPVTDAPKMSAPSTDQTAAFWFFNPNNAELLVKMVDATNLPANPAHWFFYGALSDVEYWIEVTDTETDTVREYHNLPGTICGVGDTGAFPDVQNPIAGDATWNGMPLDGAGVIADGAFSPPLDQLGSCVASSSNLCLLEGRFKVEVDFFDQHNDQNGVGTAVQGTNQAGFFWFFNANNLELAVKMVDGTGPAGNGHFWLFWGALSDVQYHIRVTDTVTNEVWERTNPPGDICGGADTTAF